MKYISLTLAILLLVACANTGTHDGWLYSFHEVRDNKDGTWYLDLVGAVRHDKEDLLDITESKAKEVCKSEDFELDYTSDIKGLNLGYGDMRFPQLKTLVKCL